MSEKYRTRSGLPVDFTDGIKVKGVNIDQIFADQKQYIDDLTKGITVINVTGHAPSGRLDLTSAQVVKPIIEITGVLTSNLTITVPGNTSRVILFVNATTGAFDIALKNLMTDGNLGTGTVNLRSDQSKNVFTNYSAINELVGNAYDLELLGEPTAPTADWSDSSDRVATTHFVKNTLFNYPILGLNWTEYTTPAFDYEYEYNSLPGQWLFMSIAIDDTPIGTECWLEIKPSSTTPGYGTKIGVFKGTGIGTTQSIAAIVPRYMNWILRGSGTINSWKILRSV